MNSSFLYTNPATLLNQSTYQQPLPNNNSAPKLINHMGRYIPTISQKMPKDNLNQSFSNPKSSIRSKTPGRITPNIYNKAQGTMSVHTKGKATKATPYGRQEEINLGIMSGESIGHDKWQSSVESLNADQDQFKHWATHEIKKIFAFMLIPHILEENQRNINNLNQLLSHFDRKLIETKIFEKSNHANNSGDHLNERFRNHSLPWGSNQNETAAQRNKNAN